MPLRKKYDKEKGKWYVQVSAKKRRYLEIPAGMSQKQFTKVIINFNDRQGRRIKKKKKKPKISYEKKFIRNLFVGGPVGTAGPGAPQVFTRPDDDRFEKLFKKLFDNLEYIPKSSKLKEPSLPAIENGQIEGLPAIENKEQRPVVDDERIRKLKDEQKKARAKAVEKEEEQKRLAKEIKDLPAPERKTTVDTGETDEARAEKFRKSAEVLKLVVQGNPKVAKPKPKLSDKRFRELPDAIDFNLLSGNDAKRLKNYIKNNRQIVKGVDVYDEYLADAKNVTDIRQGLENTQLFKIAKRDKGNEAYFEPLYEKDKDEGEIEGGGLDDGLYNTEIERIAKKAVKGHFVPVIAADEVHKLPDFVKKKNKIFSAVINTNPSASDGSGEDGYKPGHWLSVVVDARDDFPSVEFFDPLVENEMSPALLESLQKVAIKLNPDKMFKVKTNSVRRQSKSSNTCGVHSMKFIEDRISGVPWTEASGFDHYLATKKTGRVDAGDGEKQVNKKIREYKKYI